ncbi:polysaccharide deacetylase family protein [Aliikangiella sp. G2MR2-5]|uniref:polysaccharide deacetylase family protein n=1 Tax=Aliikangiella sp. G2MR2-5 TaxID=2788943 RepID=UPI0018AA70EB|nr:polysaccharide deacetylase family protein [Aliikangiella sp. G2MR2-5]
MRFFTITCKLILSLVVLSGPLSLAHSAVVIQYHHVSDSTPRQTSINPKLFQAHMDYLEKSGFKVISLESFVKQVEQGIDFDDKTVLITFDDGYLSVYEDALPILVKKQYPFTVFVNAKPIEQGLSQWMTWEHLRELKRKGATIANHSYLHQHLIRKQEGESDGDWLNRVSHDLALNQQKLDKELGKSVKALAYPYGEYNSNIQKLVRQLGYVGFAQHSGAVDKFVDLSAISRFAFGGDYGNIEDFAVKVNTLPLPVIKWKLLDSQGGELTDHVLPEGEFRPRLKLWLEDGDIIKRLNCYFSGQGKTGKLTSKDSVVFELKANIKAGRSRFNCTVAADKEGRFYWSSYPVIKGLPNGQWYKE